MLNPTKQRIRAQLEALELAEDLGESELDAMGLAQRFWNITVVAGLDPEEVEGDLEILRHNECETEICEVEQKIAELPERQKREEHEAHQRLSYLMDRAGLEYTKPEAA